MKAIENLSSNEGIALLTIVVMLSGLIGLVAVCAFVMGNEADDDARYDETRERMLEVKRALIGRLADIGGGEDVTSCGGFISDYGEHDTPCEFCVDNLLNDSGLEEYAYNDTHLFWAGYRGEGYLEANAKDRVSNDTFIDGWGNSIEVSFIDDGNDSMIEIRSRGQDNIRDEAGGNTTNYGKDTINTFCWRRPVSVEVRNDTGAISNMKVELIYPYHGVIQMQEVPSYDSKITGATTGTFDFPERIPIGLRKILVWDVVNNDTEITVYCLPPGRDTDIVEIKYKGQKN